MKTLDKKQIPQFAALCVLAAGLSGYFVIKMVAPGSAAAGTRPASAAVSAVKPTGTTPIEAKAGTAGTDGKAVADSKADDASATDGTDAPPPSAGMRNPFTIGYMEPQPVSAMTAGPATPKLTPVKQIASIKEIGPAPIAFPGAPPLPTSLSSFPVLPKSTVPSLITGPAAPPLPPSPPTWTVTGVLQGPTEKIAVLRNGEARRIVRAGDFVDSTYRVVAVSRTSVVLRHGKASYQLPLGGPKDAAGKPSAAPATAAPIAPPTPAAANPAPTATPASVSDLAGQLEQALPPSIMTNAHHG